MEQASEVGIGVLVAWLVTVLVAWLVASEVTVDVGGTAVFVPAALVLVGGAAVLLGWGVLHEPLEYLSVSDPPSNPPTAHTSSGPLVSAAKSSSTLLNDGLGLGT